MKTEARPVVSTKTTFPPARVDTELMTARSPAALQTPVHRAMVASLPEEKQWTGCWLYAGVYSDHRHLLGEFTGNIYQGRDRHQPADPLSPYDPPYAPEMIVTAGRSCLGPLDGPAVPSPALGFVPPVVQASGVHPVFQRGITAQPSLTPTLKIAGIHIIACESPITTIDLALEGLLAGRCDWTFGHPPATRT